MRASEMKQAGWVGILAIAMAVPATGQVLIDFDTDPSVAFPGIQFFGNAEWRDTGGNPGGYLKVTDAANGERGVIVFPNLGVVNDRIEIQADLRVGGGTDSPADGFSFNFARPDDPVLVNGDGNGFAAAPTGEVNLPEEGTTTGLAIGFDEWFSGGSDTVGFSVRVDDLIVQEISLPTLNGALDDPTSLQTGPNNNGLDGLGWARLGIFVDPLDATNSNLRINWKGVDVFNDSVEFAIGAGQLIFAGRTGGANAAHHIDNISIVPEPGSAVLALLSAGGLLLMRRRRA